MGHLRASLYSRVTWSTCARQTATLGHGSHSPNPMEMHRLYAGIEASAIRKNPYRILRPWTRSVPDRNQPSSSNGANIALHAWHFSGGARCAGQI